MKKHLCNEILITSLVCQTRSVPLRDEVFEDEISFSYKVSVNITDENGIETGNKSEMSCVSYKRNICSVEMLFIPEETNEYIKPKKYM